MREEWAEGGPDGHLLGSSVDTAFVERIELAQLLVHIIQRFVL
jgi:hypothetical protein